MGCCTSEIPCGIGGGDCSSNDDCKGDLVCGAYEDCPDPPRPLQWPRSSRCCIVERNSCHISYSNINRIVL